MPFRTEFDHTLQLEAAVAGAVFLGVVGLLAFSLVRYRATRPGAPSQHTEHPRLEAAIAAALLAVALVIVFVTRAAMAADNRAPARVALTVRVTGFQWCWSFGYTGTPVTVTAPCMAGQYPTLVVPAGEPIRVETTSRDVIHSFWVPAFRFKMDAFPDHVNSFVMTIPHTGVWMGHCAEFCGERHAFMTFHLRAVTPADFSAWLSSRTADAAEAHP
ncbi:MAG TPA: cytochrome c oxidase subunit II [Mycobacteriales bacterium]|nr:cytochrome c oxidase subunit II [Mycobacteriales bacterium]